MAIEHASAQVARKPWGVVDLHPWSRIDVSGDRVGELRFQRADDNAPIPALLLKLLFTNEPLSIQVHPDDEYARSIGLANGKTETWYILAAIPGAQVALGLKRRLTPPELRAAIGDGSIAELVHWRPVAKGDVIFVPAGTIHAIGAGIVLAEIQQQSDATFRLFDYGRPRALHADEAVSVADAGPAPAQSGPRRLTTARTALIASPHFVLERVVLPANSHWALDAKRETWMMVTEGSARIGRIDASVGDVVFAEADRAGIEAGPAGTSALIAYPGPDPALWLLLECAEQTTPADGRPPNSNKIAEVQS
jgi:mannose-6-phosphate isomerase